MAAAALSCLGGQIQTRLVLNEYEKIKAKKLGIKDFKRKYQIDDMIKGDVMFSATAITDGEIVDGIKVSKEHFTASSITLHKSKKFYKKLKISIKNECISYRKKMVQKNFDNEKIEFIKDNFNLDEITSKLLAIRNIQKEEINNFINPSIKNYLPNPEVLKDMNKSVERTFKSIIAKNKIGIFGDYDVDGATSTAILGKYLQEIKISYEIYIPDRKKEGYGPNLKGSKI